MMSCAKVRELQSDSQGGELRWYQRFGMWLHMRLCPPCERSEKSLCHTLDLLRELGTRDRKHSAAVDERNTGT